MIISGAMNNGVPILPVGIQAKKKYRPFTKVKLNIGDPIDFSEYKDKRNDKETLEKFSNDLMNEMIRLTNEDI